MEKIIKHEDGRTHMQSSLMQESLVSKKLLQKGANIPVKGMLNNVHMLCIGGQSIMDRGSSAILPLVEAIGTATDYQKIIGTGGGARTRHTFSIGMDLGLPVGGLARICGASEEQNRDILQFLLAPYGGVNLIKDDFQALSLFLSNGRIPISIGQPPYHFCEPPPEDGSGLPDNGPDVGLFLMAEVIGVENLVYVKDVDGIYTADPNKDKNAKQISEIHVSELMGDKFDDLPIERELIRTFSRAQKIKSFRVINGLDAGNIQKALAGETIGTRVYRDAAE